MFGDFHSFSARRSDSTLKFTTGAILFHAFTTKLLVPTNDDDAIIQPEKTSTPARQ
jgi:hypothetical protein